MSKHMLILKDSSMDEILEFLDKAETAGARVPSVIGPQVDVGEGGAAGGNGGGGASGEHHPAAHQTVAFEARQLKNLFLKLYDN